MESAVAGFQGGSLRTGQLAEGVVQGIGGKAGVEAGEGIAQTMREDDVAVIGALGGGCARGDVGTVGGALADVRQPGQGGGFNGGFVMAFTVLT